MQIYTLNTFGELAGTCTPPVPSEWSILTRIPYIFPVFTHKFDRLVWLNSMHAHVFPITGSVGTGM